MKIVEQTELTPDQKSVIIDLWNAEYPLSLVYTTVSRFDEYLNKLANQRHFLLLDEREDIVGWTFTFDRDGARWFAIIIDEKIQRRGGGTRLMNCLKETENRLFGWMIDHNKAVKLNGERYNSPRAFYEKMGFRVCPDERIDSDKMSGVKIVWHAPNS